MGPATSLLLAQLVGWLLAPQLQWPLSAPTSLFVSASAKVKVLWSPRLSAGSQRARSFSALPDTVPCGSVHCTSALSALRSGQLQEAILIVKLRWDLVQRLASADVLSPAWDCSTLGGR